MSIWVDGEELLADAAEIVFSCDCLGCLLDARAKGIISDDLYEEVLAVQRDIDRQSRGVCPACGYTHAYVSEYQPDVMHCPKCGKYSVAEGGVWLPFRQGTAIAAPQK